MCIRDRKGSDTALIKSTMESLIQASHRLAEQVYAQTAGPAGGQPGGSPDGGQPGSPEEEVIEADYEVVDEDK